MDRELQDRGLVSVCALAEVQKRLAALRQARKTVAVDALEQDTLTFESCWKCSPLNRTPASLDDLRGALRTVKRLKDVEPPLALLARLVKVFVQDCIRKEAYDVAAAAFCPWSPQACSAHSDAAAV